MQAVLSPSRKNLSLSLRPQTHSKISCSRLGNTSIWKSQTLDRLVSTPILDFSVLLDEYKSHDQSSGNCYTEDNLLYHVDRITEVYRLCILPVVAIIIIAIAYGEGHPGFTHCREIVSRSWFIKGLTRLL